MQANFDFRDGVGLVTGVVAFAGFVVTLMIKNDQLSTKNELSQKQSEMKEDMDAKHAENKQAIAVHQAEDVQKFDAISRTLTRIDGKLDRLAEKS